MWGGKCPPKGSVQVWSRTRQRGAPRGQPASHPGPESWQERRHLFAREMVGYSRKDMEEGNINHKPPSQLCKHH